MLYLLRFIDHLMVMFGETPSWDLEQKYCPDNLEVREVFFCPSMGIGVGGIRVGQGFTAFFKKKLW